MPRPPHKLWAEVRIVSFTGPDKKYPDVECKHCGKMMLNVQPGRALLSHIVICDGITAEDKEKWRRFQEVEQRKAEAARLARRSSAKRARRSSNEGDDDRYSLEHGDSPPELDIETFHLIIAKFFYAANIPFRVVDNPAFHRLCLEGRLDHLSVPTRASLSGALLDKVYTQERRETLGVLKEETYVVMETDGWTNIRDEHIVNFILTGPNTRPLFYKTV